MKKRPLEDRERLAIESILEDAENSYSRESVSPNLEELDARCRAIWSDWEYAILPFRRSPVTKEQPQIRASPRTSGFASGSESTATFHDTSYGQRQREDTDDDDALEKVNIQTQVSNDARPVDPARARQTAKTSPFDARPRSDKNWKIEEATTPYEIHGERVDPASLNRKSLPGVKTESSEEDEEPACRSERHSREWNPDEEFVGRRVGELGKGKRYGDDTQLGLAVAKQTRAGEADGGRAGRTKQPKRHNSPTEVKQDDAWAEDLAGIRAIAQEANSVSPIADNEVELLSGSMLSKKSSSLKPDRIESVRVTSARDSEKTKTDRSTKISEDKRRSSSIRSSSKPAQKGERAPSSATSKDRSRAVEVARKPAQNVGTSSPSKLGGIQSKSSRSPAQIGSGSSSDVTSTRSKERSSPMASVRSPTQKTDRRPSSSATKDEPSAITREPAKSGSVPVKSPSDRKTETGTRMLVERRQEPVSSTGKRKEPRAEPAVPVQLEIDSPPPTRHEAEPSPVLSTTPTYPGCSELVAASPKKRSRIFESTEINAKQDSPTDSEDEPLDEMREAMETSETAMEYADESRGNEVTDVITRLKMCLEGAPKTRPAGRGARRAGRKRKAEIQPFSRSDAARLRQENIALKAQVSRLLNALDRSETEIKRLKVVVRQQRQDNAKQQAVITYLKEQKLYGRHRCGLCVQVVVRSF